jgi:hypothetical protein
VAALVLLVFFHPPETAKAKIPSEPALAN